MPDDIPSCCYHCVVDGTITSWPKEAIPVLYARHQAMETICPTCNGTGNKHDCPRCIGSGTILSDNLLWATELLALDYHQEAMQHGDHWLAYLILNTAEARPWILHDFIECHEGLLMCTEPGGPFEHEAFAHHAEEALIDALAAKMRKEFDANRAPRLP
jgi:hypothetical protein